LPAFSQRLGGCTLLQIQENPRLIKNINKNNYLLIYPVHEKPLAGPTPENDHPNGWHEVCINLSTISAHGWRGEKK